MEIKNKIMVSTLSVQKDEDIAEIIAKGYGLEFFAEELPWVEKDLAAALSSLSHYRIASGAYSLHAPLYDLNLVSEKFPSISKLTINTYHDWIELSGDLGIKYVVVHPHGTAIIYINPSKARNMVKEALQELSGKAKKAGVLLAVENIGNGPTPLFDQNEFIQLVMDIPDLYALLDVGHAFLSGWDIPDVVRSLGSKLISLHLHDNNGISDDHLPINLGKLDWKPLWNKLSSLPATPYLVLEYNKAPIRQILESAREIEEVLTSLRHNENNQRK